MSWSLKWLPFRLEIEMKCIGFAQNAAPGRSPLKGFSYLQ